MKKLLLFLIIVLFGCHFALAEENCDSYYKVNINIEGNGSLKVSSSDKTFTKDGTFNIKCNEDFLFDVIPDETYGLNGVYIDGNYISGNGTKYGISEISSNVNLKVIFAKEEELDNDMVYTTYEDNISLYIDDIKEDLDKETVLHFFIKEISIVFDSEFIKNSNDNITLVANEVYRHDLNVKEQKAAKNSLYYDINLYNGEDLVEDFKGTAEIVIPYSKSDKVYVYRVYCNGKIEKIDNSYKDGKITIKVNEFGTFALSKEELNELGYLKSIIDLNNKQKIAIISVFTALALLIAFIKFRKRK